MSVINAITTALITNIKPGTPSEYQQLVPVGLWVDYSLLNAESLTQKKTACNFSSFENNTFTGMIFDFSQNTLFGWLNMTI